MSVAVPVEVTAEELARMPDQNRFELINGQLVERAMSPESAYIAGEIYANLREYLRWNPIGWALPDGAGFTLKPNELNQVRKPDASVVLSHHLPSGKLPNQRFEFAPDLAVEVLSPSDLYLDVEDKIQDYLEAGTQLVWLVRPKSRQVTVVRPKANEQVLTEADTLTGEPVLPGFQLAVKDIFPPV